MPPPQPPQPDEDPAGQAAQDQEQQQHQPQQEQQLINLVQKMQEMQQMLEHQQQQIQELLRRRDPNRIEIYDMVITGLPAVAIGTAAGYTVFKLANSDRFIDALCDSVKHVTGAIVQRISPGSLSLSVLAETPEKGKQVMEACKSFELMDDLNHRIAEYESETSNKVGRVTSVRIVSKRIEDVTLEQLEVLKENAALCIEDIKQRSVEEYEHGRDAKATGQASENQILKVLETFFEDRKIVMDAFLKMKATSKDETHRKKLEIMFNTVQEIWEHQQDQEYCVERLKNIYYSLLYKFAGHIRDIESGF